MYNAIYTAWTVLKHGAKVVVVMVMVREGYNVTISCTRRLIEKSYSGLC